MLNTTIYEQWETIKSYMNSLWFTADTSIAQKDLILTAFVHKSYASDFVPALDHNERLEFLWDGILWAAIAYLLFEWHPERSEAQMTLYKIALVREEMLAKVAREINLWKYIFISHGEEKQGWREKDVILADTFEAILWVWYEILWFESVKDFIKDRILVHLKDLEQINCKSYKSLIQEWAQQQWYPIPDYQIQEAFDDGKQWIFIASIQINEKVFGTGKWKNKKKAHEEAAKDAYKKIYL